MKVNDLTNAVNAYENVRNEADEAFKRYNGLSDKRHDLWLACRTKVSEYFFDKIYECMRSFDNYKPDETWESKYFTKFVGDKNARCIWLTTCISEVQTVMHYIIAIVLLIANRVLAKNHSVNGLHML